MSIPGTPNVVAWTRALTGAREALLTLDDRAYTPAEWREHLAALAALSAEAKRLHDGIVAKLVTRD